VSLISDIQKRWKVLRSIITSVESDMHFFRFMAQCVPVFISY